MLSKDKCSRLVAKQVRPPNGAEAHVEVLAQDEGHPPFLNSHPFLLKDQVTHLLRAPNVPALLDHRVDGGDDGCIFLLTAFLLDTLAVEEVLPPLVAVDQVLGRLHLYLEVRGKVPVSWLVHPPVGDDCQLFPRR